MVTEFGPRIPVQVAAKYDHTSAVRLCCGPYLGLGVEVGRHQTPWLCGKKSAAPAGCVQRNIDLSELRQIG